MRRVVKTWILQNNSPLYPLLISLNAWTGGWWRHKKKAGWKLQILPSFAFRDLSEYTFGKKRVWAAHAIISWTVLPTSYMVSYPMLQKKPQNTDIFPKVTRNSRTCDFNFCWLFICTYCIYKVQSLLLPNPHFQHHIIHSDELGLSQTAAYDPARSLGSVTQLPSTNCCVMLSMERRDFGSDLRKVCQDATSYRAFHLTAAETLPFVIGDDSRCSNTDTISWDLSQLGKIAKYTRRKAFVKLDFQAILTFSYTLYHVTLSFF